MNVHQETEPPLEVKTPDYVALAEAQRLRLREWKESREATPATEALDAVRVAAASDTNLMPPLVAAVKAGVTLGEISGELRRVWGTYEKG